MESTVMPSKTLTLRCKHVSRVCASCVRNYIEREIVTNRKTKVACVEKGAICSEILQYEELKEVCDSGTFAVYDMALVNKCMQEEEDFIHCSKPNCTSGQMTAGDIMKCRICNWLTCKNHRIKMHEGYTCAQYDSMVKPLRFDASMKPCPTCKIPIEKNGGCDRMTCLRRNGGCGAVFCWLCGVTYRGTRGISTVGNSAHEKNCTHYREKHNYSME